MPVWAVPLLLLFPVVLVLSAVLVADPALPALDLGRSLTCRSDLDTTPAACAACLTCVGNSDGACARAQISGGVSAEGGRTEGLLAFPVSQPSPARSKVLCDGNEQVINVEVRGY
jgi:hypothetical protein